MADNLEQPLITKYRPIEFVEMVGNVDMIAALERAFNSPTRPHSYLFSGPRGSGKTTSARIVGRMLEADVNEIDAASNNGVDAMRALVELGSYRPLTTAGKRMFIIDEAHTLSRSAWEVLLKILEEPPEFLYFGLCTTDLKKVPATIISRCFHVRYQPVTPRELEELLLSIASLEGWDIPPDVMQAVISASEGSPRSAISNLQATHGAKTREEVRRIIQLRDASDPTVALARLLLQKGKQAPWADVRRELLKLQEEGDDWDNTFAAFTGYINGALMKAEQPKDAQRIAEINEAMLFPTSTFDRRLAFCAGVARYLFGG